MRWSSEGDTVRWSSRRCDTQAAADHRDQFGPFRVHEQLGAGGMATVHRATVELGAGLQREVALKRLIPRLAGVPAFVADLIREAKLGACLSHANIAKTLDLGRVDSTYFIAMELVRGRSLASLLGRPGRHATPVSVAIAVLIEVLDAIDHAHTAVPGTAILHRDVSPSNLLIGDDGHVKIVDFGVARAVAGDLSTCSGLVKGKICYMSPEALWAPRTVDARTDLFSIGAVAWELLTGTRLFTGKTDVELLTQVRSAPIAPPSAFQPDCPPLLDEIVLTALARPVARRWQTAAAMRTALETCRRRHGLLASSSDVSAWAMRRRTASGSLGFPATTIDAAHTVDGRKRNLR